MKQFLVLLILLPGYVVLPAQNPASGEMIYTPVPEGISADSVLRIAAHVKPSERQMSWQETEFSMFIHFGMNTFTGREWGTGKEDPALFHPTGIDPHQWAAVAAMA